jgi:hypothetical protein
VFPNRNKKHQNFTVQKASACQNNKRSTIFLLEDYDSTKALHYTEIYF